MTQLLRADAAESSLKSLFQANSGIQALAFDPHTYQGQAPRIAVVASVDQHVIVELNSTPNFGEILQSQGLVCATDAKLHHRILLENFGVGPERWACIQLIESLLAGGIQRDTGPEAAALRYNLGPLPSPELSFESMGAYGQAIAQIVAAQIPHIRNSGLGHVSKLEAAAVAPIAEMEFYGMCIDATNWRSITAEALSEKDSISEKIKKHLNKQLPHDLFGKAELNLDSNPELLEVLKNLGHAFPNVKKETLKKLPPPIGPWIIRYRELAKMVSTYGESFLENLGKDGRLHPTFEQIGASTGRMACHSPNLQAVVKASRHRDCFRCAPHRRLVVADYATCELRILAQMSGDPVFRQAFSQGEDLHSKVASTLWNMPVSKTQNPDLRHRAKAVNFGLVYGMGAGGLAKNLNVSRQQAEKLLLDYFRTFPKIKDFLENNARAALERGYAETLAGRKLFFGQFESTSDRAQAERIAKNMPIQGSSADMTKLAMANLRPKLAPFTKAWLVNAVHDELVVECEAADAPEVAEILEEAMVKAGQALLADIPIEVDVSVGLTWDK